MNNSAKVTSKYINEQKQWTVEYMKIQLEIIQQKLLLKISTSRKLRTTSRKLRTTSNCIKKCKQNSVFKQNSEIIWDKDSESTFQKFKEKGRCINKIKLLPTKYRRIEKKSVILINYLYLTPK